jgi:hypothetical protein
MGIQVKFRLMQNNLGYVISVFEKPGSNDRKPMTPDFLGNTLDLLIGQYLSEHRNLRWCRLPIKTK